MGLAGGVKLDRAQHPESNGEQQHSHPPTESEVRNKPPGIAAERLDLVRRDDQHSQREAGQKCCLRQHGFPLSAIGDHHIFSHNQDPVYAAPFLRLSLSQATRAPGERATFGTPREAGRNTTGEEIYL